MTQHSDQLNELAKALSGAQAEFTAIPLDSNNPFFNSKYASLSAVIETAQPILGKHGLSVSQHIGHDDGGDTLTTFLLHQSGQWIADSMRLRPVKNDPQSQGSATTYARRYSYQAVLGLVADDDDGAASSKPSNSGQPNNRPAAKKAAPAQAPRQAKQANSSTGGGTHNLQSLMLSELAGPQRPAFLKALTDKHKGLALTAVPDSLKAEVETMIGQHAAGSAA